MGKYRKKPIVVEAYQMTEERSRGGAAWPKWLERAWRLGCEKPGFMYWVDFEDDNGDMQTCMEIHTLEGEHKVSWGDYIIQGVQGELYPCKPDIFEATYEPVTDGEEKEERTLKVFKCDINVVLAYSQEDAHHVWCEYMLSLGHDPYEYPSGPRVWTEQPLVYRCSNKPRGDLYHLLLGSTPFI